MTLMKAVCTWGAQPEGREWFLWEIQNFEEVVAADCELYHKVMCLWQGASSGNAGLGAGAGSCRLSLLSQFITGHRTFSQFCTKLLSSDT